MFRRVLSRSVLFTTARLPKYITRSINSARRRTKKSDPPIRTSIFVQEGPHIYEVPFIVQRTREINALVSRNGNIKSHHANTRNLSAEAPRKPKEIHVETTEGTAILFGSNTDLLSSSETTEPLEDLHSQYSLVGPVIENMVTEEVNCRVALEAVKEIMALESSESSGRRGKPKAAHSEPSVSITTTGRDRVMKQLTEMISKTRDSEMILQGLVLLGRDRISLPKNHYRNRLCDEALIRATNGELTLMQLIESVKAVSKYEDPTYREIVDALWIGIKIRESDISEHNLASLFKILSRFQTSRKIVKTILDKKLRSQWWRLSGSQMADILNVVQQDVGAKTALTCARKWAMLHANTANESELIDLVNSLSKIKSTEDSVEKALAKYMKKKGLHTKDPALVARILSYCGSRRIRNPLILETCGEYLTKHAMHLPTSLLAPLFVPFGYLNYRPSNGEEFWKNFERAVAAKFLYLESNDVLDILLSFIYLRRLPVDFVEQLFTYDFLDKLHLKKDPARVRLLRNKLRLIDTAMALESDRYTCRMALEMESVKNVTMKARIKRVVNLFYRDLASVVGGEDKLSKSVILGQLSAIDLYTLDLLIHLTPVNASIFQLPRPRNSEIKTAVLIHLPEHYCRNTMHLTGPETMRIRHLRKLGFHVMTLNYKMLLRLRHFPAEMKDYLIERLRVSQSL